MIETVLSGILEIKLSKYIYHVFVCIFLELQRATDLFLRRLHVLGVNTEFKLTRKLGLF